jgi:hypothetical protein
MMGLVALTNQPQPISCARKLGTSLHILCRSHITTCPFAPTSKPAQPISSRPTAVLDQTTELPVSVMSECTGKLDAPSDFYLHTLWDLIRWQVWYFSYVDALIASWLYGKRRSWPNDITPHTCTGVYLAVFCLAIGAASSSNTMIPRKIRAVMWTT